MARQPALEIRAVPGKRLAIACALAVALLWAAGPLGIARSQQTVQRAGIVVDYGDGNRSFALVSFAEAELSGIELLRRSGVDLVTVGFGALGEGVCSIAGTGCGVSPCRKRLCQTADSDSPFWQYVRQTTPGEWRLMPLGASGSDVRDGDVDGWIWTGGEPDLPPLAIDDVAAQAGAPNVVADSTAYLQTFDAAGNLVDGPSPPDDRQNYLHAVILLGAMGGLIAVIWWNRHRDRAVA